MTQIHGHVDPRFERVKGALADCFASPHELGAGLAVTIDNRPVVDLWAGFADRARTKPWTEDTLVNVYSTTKGFTAACAHRLVDQGKLDLDRPVADYWPEFAHAGKSRIPVRALLDHRAGLPAVRAPLPPEALFDWDVMTAALANEEPWWEPDTMHGYHAVTYGWLVGEVIRRVSGRTPGAYFREEIAGPLGLDAHIGLAEADDARCAELRSSKRDPSASTTFLEQLMAAPESMAAKAFTNPISMVLPGTVASRAWRGAELPSVNGHTTARAVARFYGALASGGEVDGHRVLSRQSIARASAQRSFGPDAILGVSTRFGLGFMLSQPGDTFGPNEGAFGHPGLGGSVGFADPEARLGFGYVMNRAGTEIQLDPRAKRLIEAVYACLA